MPNLPFTSPTASAPPISQRAHWANSLLSMLTDARRQPGAHLGRDPEWMYRHGIKRGVAREFGFGVCPHRGQRRMPGGSIRWRPCQRGSELRHDRARVADKAKRSSRSLSKFGGIRDDLDQAGVGGERGWAGKSKGIVSRPSQHHETRERRSASDAMQCRVRQASGLSSTSNGAPARSESRRTAAPSVP